LKFLIKIEEAMDKLILVFLAKVKAWTPEFIFDFYFWILSIPSLLKQKKEKWIPKLRIHYLKFLGYTEHYTTMFRGHIVGYLIYLRSEEF